MKEKQRINKILNILREEYPAPKPQLDFANPFELLIATILSAQCTDERVNRITAGLFKKLRIPEDYILIEQEQLEHEIFSAGYYKQKAKNIKSCCKALVEKFDGEVPSQIEELVQLPGVGRKTASVVAGNAFGIPAIAVDTHVTRLSNILGFIDSRDAVKIENRLKQLLPEHEWVGLSHWLIMHGRNVCIARRPKCEICKIEKYCPGSKFRGENE